MDADAGVVHNMTTVAANVHDVNEAHNLLHGGETVVWGDAEYQGVHKREENLGREIDWQVPMRTGRGRQLDPGSNESLADQLKASVQAKVEHLFLKVKRVFGYGKMRYRGLPKNTQSQALLLGLSNLLASEPNCGTDVGGWAQIRSRVVGRASNRPRRFLETRSKGRCAHRNGLQGTLSIRNRLQ